MQSKVFIVVAFIGLGIFAAGAIGRIYMQRFLKNQGKRLTEWVTVFDELRTYRVYFSEAHHGRVPLWPALVAMGGIIGGAALSFGAVVAHNNNW